MSVTRTTRIALPLDLTDETSLRRFLTVLVERLDIAYGERDDNPFTTSALTNAAIDAAVADAVEFLKFVDARDEFTAVQSYNTVVGISNARHLVHKDYVDTNFTNNVEASAITNVAYTKATPGVTYSQAEAIIVDNGVDTMKTKINEILVALRSADIIGV